MLQQRLAAQNEKEYSLIANSPIALVVEFQPFVGKTSECI
jgi:hypothetical protein